MTILYMIVIAALTTSTSMAQDGGKETIDIKTNIYCDHCQKCESCGVRIYEHLIDIPGIKKVRVDDEAALIKVTYQSDKVEPKAIREAINNAGFDADDQPAPAESVAKLDMCCRRH